MYNRHTKNVRVTKKRGWSSLGTKFQEKHKMTTQKTKTSALRSILAAGLVGLAGLVDGAFANTNTAPATTEVRTSGNVAYYAGTKADSGAETSYPEINHSTSLPYSTKVSGFVDLYGNGKGYFGKTIVEKGLVGKLNLRSHVMHLNDPFSQVGAGASYVLPMPKNSFNTFAKLSYLPAWVDSKAEKVDNKQILGIFACADLPYKLNLSGFAEVNVAGKEGAQFGYGELELAKKLGRVSLGANLQLNGQGAGKMTPEAIPRAVLRVNF